MERPIPQSQGLGAVLLAAGEGKRMGACKPLLPLGEATALERLATAFQAACVEEIVVVTGAAPEKVQAESRRLGLKVAHNRDYTRGMFSSVQTGVLALSHTVQAFFVLPVDYPLVGPHVFSALAQVQELAPTNGQEAGPFDVIYPICCAQRGHPPLISADLRQQLVTTPWSSNLGAFLKVYAKRPHDQEVEDISILLDMDTPADYRRLVFFAENTEAPLSSEDALYLHAALHNEERVIRHCQTVAEVAIRLTEALRTTGAELDSRLIQTAALLHDLAKGSRKHAIAGQNILTRLGFPRIGEVVGAHMVLPDEEVASPALTEKQIVYLADKLVIEDQVVTLDARAAYAQSTYGRDGSSAAAITTRIEAAQTIATKIETRVGRPLAAVLHGGGAGSLIQT